MRKATPTAVLTALACVSAVGCVRAADPDVPQWQSNPPLEANMSRAVDSIVRPLVTSGRHVGITVGLMDRDKRWVLTYGRKALDNDAPPNADTVYEIGSVTKTFTASALAILASQGKVKITDPLADYLPKSVRVPSYKGKQITLEHLAVHTSGLPRMPSNFTDLDESPLADPYAAYSPSDAYEFLASYKLKTAPGKKSEYSNLGAGLLGLALSRSTKAAYEKMIVSLVCEPLRLKDTVVTLSPDQRSRLAPGYTLKHKGKGFNKVPAGNWTFQECFAGAGALRSTANDMLTYLAAHIGVTQTPYTKVLLSMQKMRFRESDASGVGLGWQMLSIPGVVANTIWHNGGTGGYCSFIGFCPERGVGVVVLSNTSSLEDEEEDEDEAGLKLLVLLAS